MSATAAPTRAKAPVNYAESSDSDDVPSDGGPAGAPAKRVRKSGPRGPRAPRPPPTANAAAATAAAGLPPSGDDTRRLLTVVLAFPDTADRAATEWADAYEADRAAATADLLSLAVQAAGADAAVSADHVESGEVDDLVARLTAAVTAGGVADPFAKGRAGARARAAYGVLWRGAVGALASRGLLGDGYFLDKATAVLLGLSCSIVRPFRLVATQTAAEVGTALVAAALSLGAAREAATTQRDSEAAKPAPNRDTVAQLDRQAADAHRAVGDARAALDALFQGVAAARFRDVCPDVRATVIGAVGTWIRLDPAAHLSDTYLKYVAWALSDRDARVRGAALDGLTALYADRSLHSALRGFTERFTARFTELVHDVDDGVAAKGVDLVGALVRSGELARDDAGDVFRLLTEPSASVRGAAAELVAGLLVEGGGAAGEESGWPATPAPRRGRAAAAAAAAAPPASAAVDALLGVLARLAAPPVPRVDAYDADDDLAAPPAPATDPLPATTVDVVVAALAARVPVLSDFSALVAALSEDAAEARGEPGNTNAVLLLSAAVKAAATSATDKRRRGGAAGARTASIAAATAALAPALADLLTRYGAEAAKVAPLASTLAWIDLAPLASAREGGGGLTALLRKIADLAGRHTDKDAVRACARALARCAESGPGTARAAAKDVLAGAFDGAAHAAADATDALVGGGRRRPRAAEGAAATASAAWGRVASMCLVAVPGGGAGDAVLVAAQRVLGHAAAGAAVPADVVASAAAAGTACLLWRLLEEKGKAGDAAAASAAALGSAASDYAAALADAVASGRDPGARAAAAAALADLLLAFAPAAIGEGDGPARAATFSPADGMVAPLLRHCDEALSGVGGAAAAAAPGAPDKPPAVAAALMLARMLAYGVLPPSSDAAYVLLSHVAAPDAEAAAAAREGVRALRRAAGPPAVETWAKALGAAAGRDADELGALVALAVAAPPGSAADVGPRAGTIISRAVDLAFAAPARLPALAPLAALAAKVAPGDATNAAASVRSAADRAARRGLGAGAEAALHAVADALARRATAAAGMPARPAMRQPGAAAAEGASRERRISFAGVADDGGGDDDGLAASDDEDEGEAAAPTDVQLGGSSADYLPSRPAAAAGAGVDATQDEDVRRAPVRL